MNPMIQGALVGAGNYLEGGVMMTAGFMTDTRGGVSGSFGRGEFGKWQTSYLKNWGNTQWDIAPRSKIGAPHFPKAAGMLPEAERGLGKTLFSAAGPLMSGYFMYKGWKGELGDESGARGAYDALAWDVASFAGAERFGAVKQVGGGKHGGLAGQFRLKPRGAWAHMGVFMGAGIGATLGQSVLGTAGAMGGGFAGAAAGAAIMGKGNWYTSIPRALIAGAAIGGAVMVGKGAFSLIKSGYRRGAARHSIDTAGDTSAFMTRNAMTMRARSVDAMRNSHMNARSALGMEATFMHQDRNYFSNYR